MGTAGGGNWMEDPDTYNAYADLVLTVLCDGTLTEQQTVLARKTITDLRRFCHNEDGASAGPDYSDVDQLADLALEWCKLRPRLIPREPDPRMSF